MLDSRKTHETKSKLTLTSFILQDTFQTLALGDSSQAEHSGLMEWRNRDECLGEAEITRIYRHEKQRKQGLQKSTWSFSVGPGLGLEYAGLAENNHCKTKLESERSLLWVSQDLQASQRGENLITTLDIHLRLQKCHILGIRAMP